MMSFIACALFLLFQLASADQVININNGTDQALALVNRLTTQRGLGVIRLPPIKYEEIQLLNGFFVGTNSLVRTKDATIALSQNATNVTVDLHVGRSLFSLVFGLIKLNGVEMTGVYRVKNNSIHISFTVVNQTRCYVRLNNYEYETFTEVSFESSLPKYDGDVSDAFNNTVLPRLNKELVAKTPIVQQALKARICRNRFQNLQDPTHLSQLLTQVLTYI